MKGISIGKLQGSVAMARASIILLLAILSTLCVLPAQDLMGAGTPADLELRARIIRAVNQALVSPYWMKQQIFLPQGIRLLDADVTGNKVTLNFGKEILGSGIPSQVEIEEAIRHILLYADNAISDRLRDVEYSILIEDVPLHQFLSEAFGEVKPNASPPTAPGADMRAESTSGKRVAISPGHGWYWNEVSNEWRLQRDYFWGIVEDFVNAEILMYLNPALVAAGMDVRPTRNLDKGAGIGESGHPRWEEAARYQIKFLGAPSSVWGEPGYTQLDQDIRSRPNYANWVSADILVSVHNNGGGGTGTEVWYDSANGYQGGSARLAEILRRKIIDAIHSQYNSAWNDRGIKSCNGCKGENRIATRPSVIVEIAFMDTLSPDNAALQDEGFKRLVAEAISQGIVEFLGSGGDPTLVLSLNGSSFRSGQMLILTAKVTPGATPRVVDAYVAVELPNGQRLFLRGDGTFGWPDWPEPIVRNWTVAQFDEEIFRYTFSGSEPSGNYKWLAAFVEADHIIGGIVEAPFSFTTAEIRPPAPTLLAPGNGQTGISTTPTFSWTAVTGGTGSYRIMVATNPAALPTDPDTPTCTGCTINEVVGGTSFTPASPLAAGTLYYWQVHALGTTLGGVWSSRFSFTTQPACPGRFCIGDVVTVSNNGLGLNLRQCASTNNSTCPVIVWMPEGTRMTVFGGPVQADGYTWWAISGYVNSVYRAGWAIENGLTR